MRTASQIDACLPSVSRQQHRGHIQTRGPGGQRHADGTDKERRKAGTQGSNQIQQNLRARCLCRSSAPGTKASIRTALGSVSTHNGNPPQAANHADDQPEQTLASLEHMKHTDLQSQQGLAICCIPTRHAAWQPGTCMESPTGDGWFLTLGQDTSKVTPTLNNCQPGAHKSDTNLSWASAWSCTSAASMPSSRCMTVVNAGRINGSAAQHCVTSSAAAAAGRTCSLITCARN